MQDAAVDRVHADSVSRSRCGCYRLLLSQLYLLSTWHTPVQDADGRYAKLVRAMGDMSLPGVSFTLPGRQPALSILAMLNPLSRCALPVFHCRVCANANRLPEASTAGCPADLARLHVIGFH